MFGKKPFFFYKKKIIHIFLLPITLIYLFFFTILNIRFFKKKICKKTICIGNIVVGGSGKTPICEAMYSCFSKYYSKICFISKGYKRSSVKNVIIPCGHRKLFKREETGDEPLLLSDSADVFVVNSRREANSFNYDLAICDDGFFDKSIHYDCKIAVFDGNFFIGNGYVLPSGPLRCLLSSIKKADFVIITNPDEKKLMWQFSLLKKYINEDRILLADLAVKSKHNPKKKYFAFCGIGENQKFFKTLKENGINLVGFIGFNDHQNYTDEILNILQSNFLSLKADAMITTFKDFVKLPEEFCLNNNVEVFNIRYNIKDIDKIVSFVLGKDNE